MADNDGDKPKVTYLFPGGQTNKFFPQATRVKAINFYGSAIVLPGGQHISPEASHVFDMPASEEQVCEIIKKIVDRGGIMGWINKDYCYMPWPLAVIQFELVDLSPGDHAGRSPADIIGLDPGAH